jgi:hypothetical protein
MMDVKTFTRNETRADFPRTYRVGKVNMQDTSSGFHCLLVALSTLGFSSYVNVTLGHLPQYYYDSELFSGKIA